MIEKMDKLYIYSMKDQTADIMDSMMSCGVVEPVYASSMLDEADAGALMPVAKTDLSMEEDMLQRLEVCIEALKEAGPKRSLFYRPPQVTYKELTDDESLLDSMKSCEKIEKVADAKEGYEKELQATEFARTSLAPWENLDITTSDFETESAKIICYILPEPRDIDEIQEAAQEKELDVHLEKISEDEENKYITALFRKKDERTVRDTIGIFGAKEFVPDGMTGTFSEGLTLYGEKIKALKDKVAEEDAKLEAMADKREEMEKAYDAITVRMTCLSGKDKGLGTAKVDVITGWIVAEEKKKISKELEKYACCYAYEEPDEDEDFPVLMKNSKLVAPFGALTEMYSLPAPRSMDSNWAIGLFFFIFFGMMLSDAGYGLLLTVGGLLGAKFLNVGEGGKRLMTMLGISGISTIFWGLIYGSFFGDVIPTVAQVFLGKTVEIPKLIDPLNEPMVVLGLSCGLGVIHLFLGMGFKAYLMIKRGDKWGALFDVGFWYIFLIGLPCLILPGKLKMIGIVMSIAGAVGLVLTQGRDKPTLFGKISSGVMSLYDVTGYFSDVLSYSRILALGLATGVIASVVNTIGTLTGGGIVGAVLFIVIFLFGHALNLAINALGAYVHSARLQYVEFFGKYYESGGRKFKPLKAETKYVNVTEEK